MLCCVKSLQVYPTLSNPLDYSPPGSSVQGILQVRNWSRLPCPPPGDLPQPGIESASLTSPALAGGFFTTSASALNAKTSLESSTVTNTLTRCCFFLSLFIPTGLHFYFIVIVLAMLDLRCCARASSSCSGWAFHCSGFSFHGAWTLGPQVSVVMAFRLSWSTTCGIFPNQG